MSRKIIKLTESDVRSIIMECVNNYSMHKMLCENRESKNMKMARNVVKKFQPNADAQEIITQIRNEIPNSRLEDCKYLPGVTQMVMNGEINGNEGKLNTTLGLLSRGHSNEYDNYLNNEHADDLIKRFSGEVTADLENDKAEHDKIQFTENGEYEIVRITSAEEAAKYGQYTDWCITSTEPSEDYEPGYDDGEYYDEDEYDGPTLGEEMYDNYTNGGLGLFYFCLKKGFENVPREKGENNPLDEYGLSMIATSVDEDGRCNTITCRWNHDNGANDSIMKPMQLSQLIGRNYYKTFLPYTKEEIYAKGLIPFGDVEGLLKQGKQPKEIFKKMEKCSNGLYKVTLNGKVNFYQPTENTLISEKWFNSASSFNSGVSRIYTQAGQNYINEKGQKLLPKDVQYGLSDFNEGYGIYTKYNSDRTENFIIDTSGRILNGQNPIIGSHVRIMSGLVVSQNDDKYTIYSVDGNKLFDEQFDSVYPHGQESKLLDVSNIVRTEQTSYGYENKIRKHGIITPDGQMLGGGMFDYISLTSDGYLVIKGDDEGKSYIIDPQGNIVCNTKFDRIDGGYSGDVYLVWLNRKCNWMNYKENRMVFDEWHDSGTAPSNDGYIEVIDNNKITVCYTNGKPISDIQFDKVSRIFTKSISKLLPAIVELNGKYSVLTKDGLVNQWFDKAPYPITHVTDKVLVNINNEKYYIDLSNLQVLPYDEKTRAKDRRTYDKWEEFIRDERRSNW